MLSGRPLPAITLLDPTGTISADLSCRHCGYLLRGLRADTRCPECAHPVADSLRPDLLPFADPAFTRSLWYGTALTAVAIFLFGVLRVFATLLIARFISQTAANAVVGSAYAYLVAGALSAAAGWLLTAPDPARPTWLTARRAIVRWGLLLTFAYQLTVIPMNSPGAAIGPVRSAVWVANILVTPLTILAEFCRFEIIESALARVPSPYRAAVARAKWAWTVIRGVTYLANTLYVLQFMTRGNAASPVPVRIYASTLSILSLLTLLGALVVAAIVAWASQILGRTAHQAAANAGTPAPGLP